MPALLAVPWRALGAIAAVTGAAWMQGELGDRSAVRRKNDFRYTPDPRVVKIAAGPFRSAVADLIWLRALPDMGREFDDAAGKARWIHNSLEAVTDLEPTFGTAYDFGQAYLTYLGRGNPESVDRAVRLLEKGHRENPESAGMLVRLAMVHWLERKDRAKALEYLRKAQPLPDMDSLSNQMLATLEADQRDDLIALGRWIDALDKGDEAMRERNALQFYILKMRIADRAFHEFRAKRGRPPLEPKELGDPELIQQAAIPYILQDLEFKDRRPWYQEYERLMVASTVRLVERQAMMYHAERGRWPTLEDLYSIDAVKLPSAPPGKVWVLEGKRLRLDDVVPGNRR